MTNCKNHLFKSSQYIKLLLFTILLFQSLLQFNIAIADEDDNEFFAETKQTSLKDNTDPFEPFNRTIFKFNIVIFDKILVPFGDWYNSKIPLPVRWTFKNFVQNYTETPQDAILSVFDADLEAIIVSGWRFILNTSFGFFGFDDVANTVDLSSYRKTLGNVFYFYHIPRGPYLMLPFLGPSTLRDTTGMLIEFLITSSLFMSIFLNGHSYVIAIQNVLNPFYIPFPSNNNLIWIAFGMSAGNYLHIASTKATTIRFLSDSAIDRYSSFKTAYLQNLDREEEKYTKLRIEGQTTRLNVCDYDGLVDLPDECEEDPKTYNITESKNEKYIR